MKKLAFAPSVMPLDLSGARCRASETNAKKERKGKIQAEREREREITDMDQYKNDKA